MTVKVYGIPNCGSVKKALDSLKTKGETIEFHDFKKQGLAPELLDTWVQSLGLDRLINRKGTTWRNLSDADKALAESPEEAKALILKNLSLIKRPVVDQDGKLSIGQTEF
jgi:arsenate reductase